jgi:hypothetical protein
LNSNRYSILATSDKYHKTLPSPQLTPYNILLFTFTTYLLYLRNSSKDGILTHDKQEEKK